MTPTDNNQATTETPAVKKAAWTIWALAAWILTTLSLYYYNFSSAFVAANKSSIEALLDKLF